jgi:glycosyltransferase involved in cell wall biosynthesis
VKPRRVLVVTYYYPPQPGSGANRWEAMVKYMRRAGHEVTVVTAAPPGHPPRESDGVRRTRSLNSSPALRRLLLRADRGSAAPSPDATATAIAHPAVWKLIVPDPWVLTWNGYALRAMRRELARRRFDCVVTSSPAESTHLLAKALGHRRPAWVADFRDGWCFEPLREPFPLAAQRGLDRRLERGVALSADVLAAATAPIAEDLRVRFGVEARHVPNGFDPEIGVDGRVPPEYDPARLTLVHTGPLLGVRGRDPRPLLAALRRLLEDRPELSGRLQVLVAGRSEFDDAALLAEAELGDTVRHLGYLPREHAIALQRRAKALLLLTSDATCEATGKLYEYLASGRPIIALARGNEAARIVGETGTGIAVDPHDPGAIVAALDRGLSGELERAYSPHGLDPYRYPAPAERMAEAVERAVASRADADRGSKAGTR